MISEIFETRKHNSINSLHFAIASTKFRFPGLDYAVAQNGRDSLKIGPKREVKHFIHPEWILIFVYDIENGGGGGGRPAGRAGGRASVKFV